MIGELTNHLWQTTLFAIAAGLVAAALRKNRAQIGYGLWLGASLKFFVPFSLLISLGSRLAWTPAAKTIATQGVSFTMVQITQPFPDTLSFVPSAPRATHWLPFAILGVWACGFAVIALIRLRDWLRIRAVVRSSTPVEIPIPAGVEVRSSAGLLEPGVVGFLRPVLLLPAGILEHLTPPQLEAVLAHELCHVRRRDNLTSAIHMIVEAVFWFHPFVWWIGARLVEERERACDEDVLRLGSEPQVYAESILRVCKFYLESPLTCVSGVTGSDLKKRVERIMRNHIGETLDGWRKLFLAIAGVAALAVPVVVGVLTAPRLLAQSASAAQDWQAAAGGKRAFDATSIKQNKSGPLPPGDPPHSNVGLDPWDGYAATGGLFSATNFPLSAYIGFAYKLTPNERTSLISQLPTWAKTERFDIQARASISNPTKDQFRLMMQSLLADRFKLAVHTEVRQLPVFALVLGRPGKTGPQLQSHTEDPPCSYAPPSQASPTSSAKVATGFPAICGALVGLPSSKPGRMGVGARNATMGQVAGMLQALTVGTMDRPILDQTRLSGAFDFSLEYTPEFNGQPFPPDFQPDPTGPTFLEAVKEQLGLKLDSEKGLVGVLVVDHIEEPSPN